MDNKKQPALKTAEDVLDNSKNAYEIALSSSGPLTEEQKTKVGRLEFSTKTKLVLAQRVGYRCSCPECNNITIGPGDAPGSVVVLGEAAHIVGAVKSEDNLSPRADPTKTDEYIKNLDNGIWLCRHHHRLVDSKEKRYTVEELKKWKTQAEAKQEELMQQKEPIFVEKYIYPKIHTDKGIDTTRFKNKEWCLLAYLMDAHEIGGFSRVKLSRFFERDDDGHCFEDDYQSWMSDNNIDSKVSQIRFGDFFNEKQADIREIGNNLVGLVKVKSDGLYYGDAFEDFYEKLLDSDENALKKIKSKLSKF